MAIVEKEKEVVDETTKAPGEEVPKAQYPTAPGTDEDNKKGVADMGIMELASNASK